MNTRRFEEGGVQDEVPQGGLAQQGVQVPHDAQMPPQGVQVPIGCQGNDVHVVPPDMTKCEIIESILALARAMTAHVNKGVEPRVNVVESTMTSRLRDIVRMNPPIFIFFKVKEIPKSF